MSETLNFILTKFTDETIVIFSLLSLIVVTALTFYWLYNKKKFQKLAHQIPASVVKNYLDSIIQNSTALKSSLFRGGGLDITEGIPSVVPVNNLPASTSASVGGPTAEELNQKNAEIAALNNQLADKNRSIEELDAKIAELQAGAGGDDSALIEEIATLKARIAELEAALEAAKANTGSTEGGGEELEAVTKERDELKERLMEYEIIEEDLANLKRLQQENDQLKKTIEELKGGAPAEETPAPVEEPIVEEPVAEAAPAEEPAAPAEEPVPAAEGPAAEAAPAATVEGVPEEEGDQKSAEELLNEFEKMLG